MGTHDQDSSPQIKIDISPELYQRIEIAAAQNNLLIKEYIEKLLERIMLHEASIAQQERAPMTREALEGLLQLREQFKKNHPGQVFDDSTEIIRQMREERSQWKTSLGAQAQ